MNHETLWEGWSLAFPETEEEQPPLPNDTEVLYSPEKPDGSIFIYYRHALSGTLAAWDSLEEKRYWSSVFSPSHKDNVAAVLYPDALIWTDDQHCTGLPELLHADRDSRRGQVAMVSQPMKHPKTGADLGYRFIDIWAAAPASYAAGRFASFLARNVMSDDVHMRVVSIHPEKPTPEERNQKLFLGTLRKFRQLAIPSER